MFVFFWYSYFLLCVFFLDLSKKWIFILIVISSTGFWWAIWFYRSLNDLMILFHKCPAQLNSPWCFRCFEFTEKNFHFVIHSCLCILFFIFPQYIYMLQHSWKHFGPICQPCTKHRRFLSAWETGRKEKMTLSVENVDLKWHVFNKDSLKLLTTFTLDR